MRMIDRLSSERGFRLAALALIASILLVEGYRAYLEASDGVAVYGSVSVDGTVPVEVQNTVPVAIEK